MSKVPQAIPAGTVSSFSTTTPPHSTNRVLGRLQAGKTIGDDPGQQIGEAELGLSLGSLSLPRGTASAPVLTAPQQTHIARLQALDSDPCLQALIVSAEFAGHWTLDVPNGWDKAHGIGGSKLKTSKKTVQELPIGPVDFKTFDSAVASISVDPAGKAVFEAEAPMPELLLALAFADVRGSIHPSGDPDRFSWICLVVDVAVAVVAPILHTWKYQLQVPRPDDKNTWLRPCGPILPMPVHKSLPAGHAAFCAAVAKVLAIALGGQGVAASDEPYASLRSYAESIARNRIAAGLHTGIDVKAGLALGDHLGDWLLEAAADDVNFPIWSATMARARQHL